LPTEVVEAFGLFFEYVELTGRRGFASGLVDRLDLLHRHRYAGDIDFAAVAIFVVLSFPDQFGPELRERMRVAWTVWSPCVAH
jgi:hypothetical protein